MTRVEQKIVMPEGAAPLKSYVRFYAGRKEAGRRKLIGTWLSDSQRHPGAYIVQDSELPDLLDGGCVVVAVAYDVEANVLEYVECNGGGPEIPPLDIEGLPD